MAKPALGRGLGALLGGAAPAAKPNSSTFSASAEEASDRHERVVRVALNRLRPCPFQPRKSFDAAALQELADSIREQGIIQPLIVRPRADHFELIAGERRWRAAQLLGLKEVPVLVREAEDPAVLELALIENLQREDLNPLEEAQGYAELIEKFNLRQEDVAAKVGKSRAAVANSLRLLHLDPQVQSYLRDGKLSVGHAKVILALPDPPRQKLAAARVLKQGLNVRQTEELVAHLQAPRQPDATPVGGVVGTAGPDAHVADLENRLRDRFGTKVTLRYRQGKGSVEIRFFSNDELQRILQVAGVAAD